MEALNISDIEIPFVDCEELPVEVSVVLPCLNEAETVGTCIVKTKQALADQHISGEIIVADNGSTDGSQMIGEWVLASSASMQKDTAVHLWAELPLPVENSSSWVIPTTVMISRI